jgi:hypothetical protein
MNHWYINQNVCYMFELEFLYTIKHYTVDDNNLETVYCVILKYMFVKTASCHRAYNCLTKSLTRF